MKYSKFYHFSTIFYRVFTSPLSNKVFNLTHLKNDGSINPTERIDKMSPNRFLLTGFESRPKVYFKKQSFEITTATCIDTDSRNNCLSKSLNFYSKIANSVKLEAIQSDTDCIKQLQSR